MPRQRGRWGSPRQRPEQPLQHPVQPRQHPRRQRLNLAAMERMNRQQWEDGAGQEDLGEGHEQPARDEETARAGGDALDQSAANTALPRWPKWTGGGYRGSLYILR